MRKKNVIMRRIVLLCGTMLIIGGAWGASNLRAKYVSSVTLTGEVDFSPSLASDVTLLEHTVDRVRRVMQAASRMQRRFPRESNSRLTVLTVMLVIRAIFTWRHSTPGVTTTN